MRQTAFLNSKGVTLVEVMISLVILLIVFMGLIQASMVSINSNVRNEVMDGATGIASEYMSRAKSTSIDALAGVSICPAPPPPYIPPPPPATFGNVTAFPPVTRQVRNASQTYNVNTSSCFYDASLSNALVRVTVTYQYPGDVANPHTTNIDSFVRRP